MTRWLTGLCLVALAAPVVAQEGASPDARLARLAEAAGVTLPAVDRAAPLSRHGVARAIVLTRDAVRLEALRVDGEARQAWKVEARQPVSRLRLTVLKDAVRLGDASLAWDATQRAVLQHLAGARKRGALLHVDADRGVSAGRMCQVLAGLRGVTSQHRDQLRWPYPLLGATMEMGKASGKLVPQLGDLKPPARGDVLLIVDHELPWTRVGALMIACTRRGVARLSIAVMGRGEGQRTLGVLPIHLPESMIAPVEEVPIEEK